jgi:GNAT superfamily N-acetyltransferase
MTTSCRRDRNSTSRSYRIREVDGHDDEIADILTELHRLTFFNGAAIPPFDWGHWWLAYHETMPVAFAGAVPSTHVRNAGYFCRVGVLQPHWGNRLQLRLMRAIERRARQNGWRWLVSDTTGNVASANNFIRAGYLGSGLIKPTIQEQRSDRQRPSSFEPVCHSVLRYGGSPLAC